MKMNSKPDKPKIHIWDGRAIATALFLGAVIEGLSISPLVIFGMGHAGPNGEGFGYISLFLNIFGIGVAVALTDKFLNTSWLGLCVIAFLIQTAFLSYIFFIFIRKRKLKPENSLKITLKDS